MNVLVTGAAGFIGSYVTRVLLDRGEHVTGIDNLNDYYDPSLKRSRLQQFEGRNGFRFIEGNIADRALMQELFRDGAFQRVVHLAAQAGVRYSLENPHVYIESNINGFLNVLEGCRHSGVEHLVFASSSSVYGANTAIPFSEHGPAGHPVSLYGATKRSNELMAHSYAHLYRLPVTGLRFFTVYGPWGRPDMSPFLFTRKILAGDTIDVFNYGNHARDFTYIDDIVEGVMGTFDHIPAPDPAWDGAAPDPATSNAPFRLYNIGHNSPVALMDFIAAIEEATGKTARINLLPLQPGDVLETYADIDDLHALTGFKPTTPIEVGIRRFVEWYRGYYRV
jgi:UDP-glucuronate 4-epimerase